MRCASLFLAISLLPACGAFDPDDGTRALTGTTISSWTGASVGEVVARVCLDDGSIHTSDWGAGCAIATGLSDYQGGFRIEGLEPEVYQLYLEGPAPWGSHATLVSLVADNGAISVEIDPASVAGIQVVGDLELGDPQIKLRVGPAASCGPNELVLDLPAFDAEQLEGTETDGCIELENNDFVGKVAFTETARSMVAGACGDTWCEEWTIVTRTARRRGDVNAILDFEDKSVQLQGTWLE